jgi:hypothetical protein
VEREREGRFSSWSGCLKVPGLSTTISQGSRGLPFGKEKLCSETARKEVARFRVLVVAHKQATSREILLWMTPSEAPKALQASECSELLDPTRANCWISAQHQPGKFTQPLCRFVLQQGLADVLRGFRSEISRISTHRAACVIGLPRGFATLAAVRHTFSAFWL